MDIEPIEPSPELRERLLALVANLDPERLKLLEIALLEDLYREYQ